jgi:hypothetical protein
MALSAILTGGHHDGRNKLFSPGRGLYRGFLRSLEHPSIRIPA